ncbi:predicted protein [Nematostella vectensis]|uniref:YqaJ viral recombinase domain-containing protein n=1 Tax=Nematostella vectensis TaxID=45351 RepID=A7SZ01_NEMVE|nr:predicted protein [Nematostella vectensis]|eukprot:XP_001623162.1 predicted protein [Nematostella vectensis]
MDQDQRSLATLWANKRKSIEGLLPELELELSTQRLPEAKATLDTLLTAWKAFEGLHVSYVHGINSRERLQLVQEHYTNMKRQINEIIAKFEQPKSLDEILECGMDSGMPDLREDAVSIANSRGSQGSRASSRKSALTKTLLAQLKLERAEIRIREELEYKANMELDKLAEEADIADLEWRIESGFNEETGHVSNIDSKLDKPAVADIAPGVNDPVTVMKIQMLNGIKPTQFTGNPADFPFFREQIRTHFEGGFLTDAQRPEYLPKFVTGEALDVVKHNRGCSFEDIMKTLEKRYGQTIHVTQAFIDELVSGPKIAYGDNVALLNYSDRLNAATKILSVLRPKKVIRTGFWVNSKFPFLGCSPDGLIDEDGLLEIKSLKIFKQHTIEEVVQGGSNALPKETLDRQCFTIDNGNEVERWAKQRRAALTSELLCLLGAERAQAYLQIGSKQKKIKRLKEKEISLRQECDEVASAAPIKTPSTQAYGGQLGSRQIKKKPRQIKKCHGRTKQTHGKRKRSNGKINQTRGRTKHLTAKKAIPRQNTTNSRQNTTNTAEHNYDLAHKGHGKLKKATA